ncbi:MAG: HEAT repeat domain-containing protein [Candidatus Zixiibacteriota bacterium]
MNRSINLSEKSLTTDIRDISREVAHELFLICRKAGIYTVDHPMVVKGVAKPFLGLQKVFSYKKYFDLYFIEGRLYANNILITDIGASTFLKDRMHEFDIKSILFSAELTTDELLSFISRLVTKVSPAHPEYKIEEFLRRRRIDHILINHPLAEKIFNAGLKYRDGQYNEYTVRRIVSDYFAGDIYLAVKALTEKYASTTEQIEETGIDYYREIVAYLLPEKFAQLPPSELMDIAREIITGCESFDDDACTRLNQLISALDYHPRRIELYEKIKQLLTEYNIDRGILKRSLSGSIVLQKEVGSEIDRIVNKFFSKQNEEPLFDSFHDHFMRLVRTRQMGKASSIAEQVISYLSSEDALYRQYSMILTKDLTKSAVDVGEIAFLDVLLTQLKSLFTRGLETIEFAEVAVFLIRIAISNRRYAAVADFLHIIRAGRKQQDDVMVYDSIAIRRVFEQLNDRELISFLIREIHQNDNNSIKATRDILIAMQSDEVALQLAQIVAHHERHVRQHSLKILSALGKPAVTIFSEVLRDETNFYRPADRRELPDEKWYLIRNAIFVLGNLRDSDACNALRLRLTDSDIRVRMEIIKALEKIDGDDGVDLLMILCEDSDETVREAAIIALGLFNRQDLLPFFKDLLMKQKNEVYRIVNAIAQTGNPEAYQFLEELAKDKDRIKDLSSGKASASDIKKMILAAMEKFGDDTTKKRVEELQQQSTGQLSKTARMLLGKMNSK